jgi:hypothetical protein
MNVSIAGRFLFPLYELCFVLLCEITNDPDAH